MERGLAVERQLPLRAGAGAGEGTGDYHLRRREGGRPAREPGRIAEARRAEERVRLVDPVVDDPDLDAVAAVACRRPHLVGADDRRALVGVERVADAGVEPGHEVEPGERRQLAGRQRDGEAVQHDPVAIRNPRGRDRTFQLGGGGALGSREPGEIEAGARAADVEARGADRAEEVPVVGGERGEPQVDEHGQAPV